MREHCLRLEGPNCQLGQAIYNFRPGYQPRLLFIFVNKMETIRFFQKEYNGRVRNPVPGTVVDTQVVRQQDDRIFDFYLVANQNPRDFTAKPVHYEVVVNTTQLKKE